MLSFSSYKLDDRRRVLLGKRGEISLEPRVMDLLLYLIRNRDRAVSSQEIVQHVWAGACLERSALPGAVKKLRRALDDAREVIATVRGYGFRFEAEVSEPSATAPPAAPLDEVRNVSDLALPAITALPFRTAGALDRDLGLLFSEDLLARLHEYRVLPVLVPEVVRGSPDPGACSLVTGPRYRMRGAFTRGATGLGVTAALIDTHHSQVVWCMRTSAAQCDPPDAIAALSLRVACSLWTAFMFGRVIVPRSPLLAAGDSWALTCAGWRAYWSETPESMLRSLDLFEAALRIDERSPWALVGRSVAQFTRHYFEPECTLALQAALADVASAAELDPGSALPRAYHSIYQAAMGRSREAGHALARTRALAPGLAWTTAVMADLQAAQDPAAALELYREALVLNPMGELHARILTGMATARRFVGDLEGALRSAEAAIRAKPAVPYGYVQAAAACGALGQASRGEHLLERMRTGVRSLAPRFVHAHVRLKGATRPQYAEETLPRLRAAGWGELL